MGSHIQVRHPKTMAFILMLGAFAGLFGETALNMALTNIMDEFAVKPATAQWLTTGYLLALAVLVPASALLMRWFTTRALVIGGLGISLLGTIIAAAAPSFPILLLGRIVHALGTGLLLPVMFSVVLLIFPIEKRGIAMGLMGLVITAAPAAGPTLSGVIVSTLGWPYIFWFSAIFYVLLLALAYGFIVNVSEITKPKIDYLSIVLSTVGFGGTIYALSTLAEASFASPEVWGPLAAGLAALGLFIRRQLTLDEPVVNLSVFRYPMFALGVTMTFIGLLIILSTAILLPLYLKGSLLLVASVAGLVMLPGNTVNIVMSPIVGGLYNRLGPRVFVIAGFLIVLLGNAAFLLTLSTTTPVWQIIAAFFVLFIGIPMVMMPAQTNGLNQLPRRLYADGSAAMNTLNQVAGAAGTAVAITLFTSGQNAHLLAHPDASDPAVIAAGIRHAFLYITGLSAVGLAVSLFVVKARPAKEDAEAAMKASPAPAREG